MFKLAYCLVVNYETNETKANNQERIKLFVLLRVDCSLTNYWLQLQMYKPGTLSIASMDLALQGATKNPSAFSNEWNSKAIWHTLHDVNIMAASTQFIFEC